MNQRPTFLTPDQHPWLHDSGLNQILQAIAASGGEARIVGGAVRDALLGRVIGEIDLAVNRTPDVTATILRTAGIKTVPTGIEHGTLTAVVDHKGYEITSLRRDIETDGRRAKVSFTEDWQEDAARRDFTFNALYLDAAGQIYDYFAGRDDLAAQKVRFIGDSKQRIREDVLRILRFFRFYAWFGQGDPDPEGLTACRDLGALLPQLSVERIWREITKLLAAPSPLASWQLMQHNFILAQILPEADNTQHLENIIEIEKEHAIAPSSLRRLAALIPPHAGAVHDLARRLKLSNEETENLHNLVSVPPKIRDRLTPDSLPTTLYEYGTKIVQDAALLLSIEHLDVKNGLKSILEACFSWKMPDFPLRGDDLLHIGLKPGPSIGIILRNTEQWWINQAFRPDHAACLEQARLVAGLPKKE